MVQFFATNRDGEQSMTVFGSDWQKPVAGTHPNFGTLLEYLLRTPEAEHDEEYVRGLVDPTVGIGRALQEFFGDRVTFDLHHIRVDGLPMSGPLAQEIKRRMLAVDQDWARLAKFMVRLEENPSKQAKGAVWEWVEKHGVTITEDGLIVGYKGLVNGTDALTGEPNVPVSYHAGPNNFIDGEYYGEPEVSYHVPHRLGTTISKRRADVDDNNSLACSTGLHVGAYSYAKTFGENREDGARYSTMGRMADSLPNSTFALVTFDPADVVSVPSDGTADWKIRVSKYTVTEFLSEVKDVLKDMPSYDVKTAAPFIPEAEKAHQEEQPPVGEYVAPEPVERSEERQSVDADLENLDAEERVVYDAARKGGLSHSEALDAVLDTPYGTDQPEAEVEAEAPSNVALADLVEPSEGTGLLGRVVLRDWAEVNPGLEDDLHRRDTSGEFVLGHKAVARKYSDITTEASVRRYRKALSG